MNNQIDLDRLHELELALGYKFVSQDLLIQALSHPSLRQHSIKADKIVKDNERLELLGDSILGFVITELIYKNYESYSEGKLATVKSHLVCRETLCFIADKINLAEHIIMTRGEERSGGRKNPNNLENTMEALIGAIYLDSDLDMVKKIIYNLWTDSFASANLTETDSKSALQELAQSMQSKALYVIKDRSGPAHLPIFTVEVSVNEVSESATGNSLKVAQMAAAKKLLKLLLKEE